MAKKLEPLNSSKTMATTPAGAAAVLRTPSSASPMVVDAACEGTSTRSGLIQGVEPLGIAQYQAGDGQHAEHQRQQRAQRAPGQERGQVRRLIVEHLFDEQADPGAPERVEPGFERVHDATHKGTRRANRAHSVTLDWQVSAPAPSPFFDAATETLSRTDLCNEQLRRVIALLDEVLPRNAFYARKFGADAAHRESGTTFGRCRLRPRTSSPRTSWPARRTAPT